MKKISEKHLRDTIANWRRNPKSQRLGQYLVNVLELRTDNTEDTQELFYTADEKRALAIVYENFVEN